jgi:hypothetical protein
MLVRAAVAAGWCAGQAGSCGTFARFGKGLDPYIEIDNAFALVQRHVNSSQSFDYSNSSHKLAVFLPEHHVSCGPLSYRLGFTDVTSIRDSPACETSSTHLYTEVERYDLAPMSRGYVPEGVYYAPYGTFLQSSLEECSFYCQVSIQCSAAVFDSTLEA